MYLVSGGLNNTVNIWDLKSKRVHRSLKVRNLGFVFFFNPHRNGITMCYQTFLFMLVFCDKNEMFQN